MLPLSYEAATRRHLSLLTASHTQCVATQCWLWPQRARMPYDANVDPLTAVVVDLDPKHHQLPCSKLGEARMGARGLHTARPSARKGVSQRTVLSLARSGPGQRRVVQFNVVDCRSESCL